MRILKSAEGREPCNWSNLVTAYHVIVSSYIEQNNTRDAYLAAEEFMAKQIPQQYADLPHIKKNIKIIADVQKKYYQ